MEAWKSIESHFPPTSNTVQDINSSVKTERPLAMNLFTVSILITAVVARSATERKDRLAVPESSDKALDM